MKNTYKKTFVDLSSELCGYLISFDSGKQSQSTREILDVLHQYADKFYPLENNEVEDLENKPFGEVLIQELENEKKGNKKRFFNVPSKMKGTAFIRIVDKNISAVKFLSQIYKDMSENQDTCPKTRFTSRVVPIEGTCKSHLDSVMRIANKLIPPHFHPPAKTTRYKIELKRRANNSFPRDDCTKHLTKLINHDNYVDLKNPAKIVTVEIMKNVAAMSVVDAEDFKYGFNIRHVMGKIMKETPTPKRKHDVTTKEEKTEEPANKKQKNSTSLKNDIALPEEDEEDPLEKVKEEVNNKKVPTSVTTAPSLPTPPVCIDDDSSEEDFKIFG